MARPRASAKTALLGMPTGYSQSQPKMYRTKSTSPPRSNAMTPPTTSFVRFPRNDDGSGGGAGRGRRGRRVGAREAAEAQRDVRLQVHEEWQVQRAGTRHVPPARLDHAAHEQPG